MHFSLACFLLSGALYIGCDCVLLCKVHACGEEELTLMVMLLILWRVSKLYTWTDTHHHLFRWYYDIFPYPLQSLWSCHNFNSPIVFLHFPQIRGSMPFMWDQIVDLTYKPKFEIVQPEEAVSIISSFTPYKLVCLPLFKVTYIGRDNSYCRRG